MKNELILALAHIMPEEMIIEELGDSITEYKNNPSEENKNKICAHASLLMTKQIIKEEGGLGKTTDKLARITAGIKIMTPGEQ